MAISSTGGARKPIFDSNPFSTCFIRPGALPFYAAAERPDSSDLLQKFCQQRSPQAAIVGPHGSGKSTLLKELVAGLHDRFSPIDSWSLHAGESPPSIAAAFQTAPGSLLVIDGFEQLPVPVRWALVGFVRWRGAGLLVTSHQRVCGLPELWAGQVEHSLARRLTEQLLCKHPAERAELLALFEVRWQQHRPNLRDTWFALYDDYERIKI
ncbi:hypothetical protein FF011L_42200 [Roseimaritima multifibrata]|uniref:AAA+ ATPase domain-containing protein n=1 Tax=Roseimaritima multifibrata TaxID=1930274 RepID=A0A517MKM1_9BACT|nr:hypothetical protein FF011L_42200 [Roseimaritima multifibrata]